MLNTLFNPKSIAVIGVSHNPNKLGSLILKNILENGYQGNVYPINPNADKILGLSVYKSVQDIPQNIDLAVIAIPAPFVPQVVKECIEKKVKNIIVISAGFKEIGKEGEKREKEIQQLIKNSNTRLLGVNCLGLISNSSSLNASFAATMPKNGNIAFMSQSGAFCTSVLDWAEESRVGFKYFVSLGNKTDITELDLLQQWENDESVKVIVAYLESITEGKQFMQLATKITKKKPIIVLHPGKSVASQKAIASHTGSMTTNATVISTAFKQSNIIEVNTMEEMFDLMQLLSWQKLPKGPKTALVTNAGGPGVLATDLLYKNGLEIAKFSQETEELLKEKLPRTANIHNPVDVIGDALADRYKYAIDAVLKEENVDNLIILLTPQIMTQIEKTAKYIGELAQKNTNKTIIASFIGGSQVEKGINVLEKYKIPAYPFPNRAIKSLSWAYKYTLKPKEQPYNTSQIMPYNIPCKVLPLANYQDNNILLPRATLAIASFFNIPVGVYKIIKDSKDIPSIYYQIKPPIVLKIMSHKALHKTELKGVYTNINTIEDATNAYENLKELQEKIQDPQALIIAQKQLSGTELIIGVKKNSKFGHILMFGAGGILTELYKDVSHRIIPVTSRKLQQMVEETKISTVLKGYRNQKLAYDKVLSVLKNIQKLVLSIPQIKELDINPLIVTKKEATAVDIKIIME